MQRGRGGRGRRGGGEGRQGGYGGDHGRGGRGRGEGRQGGYGDYGRGGRGRGRDGGRGRGGGGKENANEPSRIGLRHLQVEDPYLHKKGKMPRDVFSLDYLSVSTDHKNSSRGRYVSMRCVFVVWYMTWYWRSWCDDLIKEDVRVVPSKSWRISLC